MKETIYTIPLNEAFDTDCECPLCLLNENLEKRYTEEALGAGMMEPDHRIESNEKGFCNRHFSMMYAASNRLSLALVLDTHMKEVIKKLNQHEKASKKVINAKNGLFKPSAELEDYIKKMSDSIDKITDSCVICDKINDVMEKYIDILFYLWQTEPDFKKKFDNSKGFCLPHYKILLQKSVKYLKNDAGAFLSDLYVKQKDNLDRIQDELGKFILKFDYRYKDMDIGDAKDSPKRAMDKLSSNITIS